MATYEDFSTQQFVRVSDIVKEPQKMLMPIAGYEDMPLVPLEEAVEPLVHILPRVRNYVYVAKQRCEAIPADNLTRDESSSIMLYTMEWQPEEKCLYFVLNATLRSEDRRKLIPWFSYLKLILTALTRLPSNRHFAYRGVKMDLSEQYPRGKTFIWWAFSSCTSSIETLENPEYLGEIGSRTLFTIDCNSGKDTSRHSYYQSEEEILLLPARQFVVKACLQPSPDLHMIQLKEVEAPICLLEPVAIDSDSNKSSLVLPIKLISSRTGGVRQQKNPVLKANPHCPADREINILLLGQTGVGKSSFINAFGNHIVNDTLEPAVNDEMQAIIPTIFSFTDPETFEEKRIVVGELDEYETLHEFGSPCTRQCRSFVFPIGDRNLRLIDTPGIADTRGLEQDTKNFHDILTYIAQYEHLNAVFIMLKPNEERLTVLFRFSVNELLRHLHVDAKNNIVFIFTNARSTFFMPGWTKNILQELLDEHRTKNNVDVPFSKDNTFLFDNEPFRYLALCKNGVRLDKEQIQSYTKSWDHSVKEYSRLMDYVNSCELHAISNMLSLNEAERLLRKLLRPITKTTELIEENIQLAIHYEKNMLKNGQIKSQRLDDTDKCINGLREEEKKIRDVYKKLARFLHAKSILPINDGYIEYLYYFIREEQMKQNAGAHNTEVIASLETMMTDYNNQMELFQKTLQDQRGASIDTKILRHEEVFTLVATLYHLPINGKRIREQVEGIRIGKNTYDPQREIFVALPAKAASSKLMFRLRLILSAT